MSKQNNKGFTLGELLIVVAIVSVLVSISIPLFSKKKQAAIDATNMANIRIAKSAVIAEFMDGTFDLNKSKEFHSYSTTGTSSSDCYIYYLVKDGKVVVRDNNNIHSDNIKKISASEKVNGVYQNIMVDVDYDKHTGNVKVYTVPFVDDQGVVRYGIGINGKPYDSGDELNKNHYNKLNGY